MAKKISIFVEGQTERIFVEKLLDEYLTAGKYIKESQKLLGETARVVRAARVLDNTSVYILIFDVGGDGALISALLERGTAMLQNDGYDFLVGLRDLHPLPRDEKSKVVASAEETFRKRGLGGRVKCIFAIMEIEAWFLAEHTAFQKINSRLTPQFVKDNLGLDLVNDDPESYEKPAKKVNDILKLVGDRYRKREKDSYRITHRIDFSNLILHVSTSKIPSFRLFLRELEKI